MGKNRYKVTAEDEHGNVLICEMFDDKDKAKAYYRTLQKDGDNPLDLMECRKATISYMEATGWTLVNRKIVVMDRCV